MTNAHDQNSKARLLSQKPEAALQDMIKMTRKLVNMIGREAQALATNDLMSFAIMQDEKQIMAERYVEMSREFRARIEEFRGADSAILDRLEQIQKDLADATRDTNKEVGRVRGYALQATRSTLFTAQELSQTRPVEFQG
jgi:hypothetical protein